VPNIRAPFPDVAEHIMQAPRIGLFHSDGSRLIVTIQVKPRIATQQSLQVRRHFAVVAKWAPCAKKELGWSARAASIFPFSFGRQANVTSALFTDAPTERDGVVPTDAIHWVIRRAKRRRIVGHYTIPLHLRDRKRAHKECR